MIENFLRPPRSIGEYTADALRLIGALSVIAAAIWFTATDAGIVGLTLPALVAPRFLGLRPIFDIVTTATVLVAAWSNVFDLYTRVAWWDIAVHLVCTGVLAVLLYVLCAYAGVVAAPRTQAFTGRAAIVLVTAFGLALSAVWEMIEWLGKTLVTDDIFVTYDDTIGDMAVGGLGALLAGCLLARAVHPLVPHPALVRKGGRIPTGARCDGTALEAEYPEDPS